MAVAGVAGVAGAARVAWANATEVVAAKAAATAREISLRILFPFLWCGGQGTPLESLDSSCLSV
jgi:hypothetical protein